MINKNSVILWTTLFFVKFALSMHFDTYVPNNNKRRGEFSVTNDPHSNILLKMTYRRKQCKCKKKPVSVISHYRHYKWGNVFIDSFCRRLPRR